MALSGISVNRFATGQLLQVQSGKGRGSKIQQVTCTVYLTFNQFRDLFAISYVASFSSVFTIKPSQLPEE